MNISGKPFHHKTVVVHTLLFRLCCYLSGNVVRAHVSQTHSLTWNVWLVQCGWLSFSCFIIIYLISSGLPFWEEEGGAGVKCLEEVFWGVGEKRLWEGEVAGDGMFRGILELIFCEQRIGTFGAWQFSFSDILSPRLSVHSNKKGAGEKTKVLKFC